MSNMTSKKGLFFIWGKDDYGDFNRLISLTILFKGLILLLGSLILFFIGFNTVKIHAGGEGVIVKKPYFYGNGGVSKEPLVVGRVWKARSTEVSIYDIRATRYPEPFNDLIAKGNETVDFNSYVVIKPIKGKTPYLHENFSNNWYAIKVKEKFRTYVRNDARGRKVFDIVSNEVTIIEMQENIKAKLVAYIKDENIPVLVLDVIIGKATPAAEVLEETGRTAAQKQRKRTEVARKNAEDIRKAAEESKALADKAYMVKFGMSTDQYLRLRQLEIEKEKIEMVKTKQNVHIIMNSGGGQTVSTFKVGGK